MTLYARIYSSRPPTVTTTRITTAPRETYVPRIRHVQTADRKKNTGVFMSAPLTSSRYASDADPRTSADLD